MNISCGIIRYEIHQQSVALLMDSSYFLSYKRFFNADHPTFCPGNRKFFTIFYHFIKMLLYLQRLSCVIRQQACLEGVLSGFWSDNLSPRFLGMSFKIK